MINKTSAIKRISRGDIYYYDFGNTIVEENIEYKTRPVVIVSNDEGNNFGNTVIIAPITTRSVNSVKSWQAAFMDNDRPQVILCEQLRCVNINSLGRYVGRLEPDIISKLDIALSVELGLDTSVRTMNKADFLRNLNMCFDSVISKKLDAYENFLDNVILKKLNDMKSLIEDKISTYESNSKLHDKIDELMKLLNNDNSNISINNNDNNNVNDNINNDNNDDSNDNNDALSINKVTESSYMPVDTLSLSSENEEKTNENDTIVEESNIYPKSKKKKYNLDSVRQKIDYSDIDALKEFLKECDDNSVEKICEKYSITKKQLSNRKWLIKKYLKENNI